MSTATVAYLTAVEEMKLVQARVNAARVEVEAAIASNRAGHDAEQGPIGPVHDTGHAVNAALTRYMAEIDLVQSAVGAVDRARTAALDDTLVLIAAATEKINGQIPPTA